MTQCNCKLYARGGAGGGGGSQQRAEVADGADVVFTDVNVIVSMAHTDIFTHSRLLSV